MEFTIFRDLASIAFVRCISPVSGTNIYAEGVAFSVADAIDKCRSEVIERHFTLHLEGRACILGIAAHPNPTHACENAWNESAETLLLENLAKTHTFYGVPLLLGKKKLWLGRIDGRFVCFGLLPYCGVIAATQSVAKNPAKAILKTWIELRNIEIYRPSMKSLSSYTKANRILGQCCLASLVIKFDLRANPISYPKFSKHLIKKGEHYIAYLQKETT